jgi:glutathione synthase/RimK-type ligase-like ATP-grasp enzyme
MRDLKAALRSGFFIWANGTTLIAMKIAFVTCVEFASLTDDDKLAIPALTKLGHEALPVVWDSGADFDSFDALVFRSCWDYHLKTRAFHEFLENLKTSQARVFNAPKALLWNLNKKHLLELEQNGVSIPQTQWFARGARSPAIVIESEKLVLKPAISLNGYDTYLVDSSDTIAIEKYTEIILAKGDLIAQEYLPEIKETGELSFLFFNGKFSHAARKLPKTGEFRIHEEYGGTRTAFIPTPDHIAQAKRVVFASGFDPLYARVDAIDRGGELILIELELLDPSLYLEDAVGADRFANAIDDRLHNRT